MTRWVLHVDLDQFVAAVEVLRRPELAGRPVIVGGRGDPTERAVVSTASYEAREHGVGSGMPLRVAARKCPDAVILPVDHEAYDAASAVVMATLRSLTWDDDPVVVEVLGWDEAFVAARPPVNTSDRDPFAFAAHVRGEVLAATGLHCSVGIGDNKLQAKIATDFGKPRGAYRITSDTWFDEMGARPVTALWGVGKQTAKRLAPLGIETVRQLAETDEALLAAKLGPTTGPWLSRLGRGAEASTVSDEPWVPRAHGREETFQRDLEWPQIPDAVRALTTRVVADIERAGRPAARVHIKVRYPNFFTVTRVRTLKEPSSDPVLLGEVAVSLLERVEQVKPVRLLGVRLEMVPPEGGY
jgi:DNA polymerase-4